MTSKCGHQWHLAAPLVPRFCSYHILTPSVKETIYLAPISAFWFWPVPSVLVSQTERNSRRHGSSHIVKKWVRFGSRRLKKKLITQHGPPLPCFFFPLLLSRCSIWRCILPSERPEQPMFILPHSHAPFSLFTVCPKEAIPLSGSGKISSINFPKSNYTASRNCTWNITAPADKIVMFTFTDFVFSKCSANPCSDSCSYVELYDGGSTRSRLLGRFCRGSLWNKPQFSTGNQMFVMFHPGQTVDRGFQAKYKSTTTGGEYPVKVSWISSFRIVKYFSYVRLVLTRYATVYALAFNLFYTSIFLKDRQTFAAHHDHSELLSPFFERKHM